MEIVYLDNSSTTAVIPEAAEAVMRCMTEEYGNPSSLHDVGMKAFVTLKEARETVASALKVSPEEVFFTSGGTEGNNLAVFGTAEKNRRKKGRVVVSAVEHPCVLGPAQKLAESGFEVVTVTPDGCGRIGREQLEDCITPDTVLVSLMLVNNETGAVQDVAAAAALIKEKGAPALLHCDAVQAFGKLPVEPRKLGVDLLTVSAHKLHGPKGVGAIYIRKGVNLPARVLGGGQEKGMRPGTEPTQLIAGFAAAVKALPDTAQTLSRVGSLNARLREGLSQIAGVSINSPDDALPYVLNFSVAGIRSEVLLRALSADGIYVSAGSACSKGKRSHVLLAQGLSPERIDSAVRVSFSRFSVEGEVDRLLESLKRASASLKRGRR